ncbi:hypothetical protein V6N13_082293 [Hibiscus sabdariffa]
MEKLKGWAEIIRCSVDRLPTTYLGLPLGYVRNSKELWRPVLENFRQRLEGWKGKLLSFGGRITLLRSVCNNLPVYFMSLFCMPVEVAKTFERMMASFLWGNKTNRSIHWVRWKDVCRPKEHGGLGLVDIRLRNRSLLNKWIWRFGSENGSLWRKVVTAKYNLDPSSLWPKLVTGRNVNWIWKDISRPLSDGSDAFMSQIRFKLGNGRNINFWEDFWTEVPSLKVSFPRIYRIAVKKAGKVYEFGAKSNRRWVWNIELRRDLFSWELRLWESFLNILNTAALSLGEVDQLTWIGSATGAYRTMEFCKKVASAGGITDKIWQTVWTGLVPPTVESFIWKVVRGRIPTLIELGKRGCNRAASELCVLCSKEAETVPHLLCHCEVVWKVWSKWLGIWQIEWAIPGSIHQLSLMWDHLITKVGMKEFWRMSFCSIIWTVWLCRNEVLFNNKFCDAATILDLSILRLGFWSKGKWSDKLISISDFVRNPVCFS